jgi:hypothetical protein
MQQLAQMMGGRDGQNSGPTGQLAGPLLMQGMMMLQQAATLDPRLAPQINRALSNLRGGKELPEGQMHSDRSSGVASPGGVIPI